MSREFAGRDLRLSKDKTSKNTGAERAEGMHKKEASKNWVSVKIGFTGLHLRVL